MADVKEFEIFHGVALTKLMRNAAPVTLRMIETDPSKAWAAYTINNEVTVYMKYNTAPYHFKKSEGVLAWNFMFGLEELQKIKSLQKDKSLYAVMICVNGKTTIVHTSMYTCLIEANIFNELIDTSSSIPQTVTIKYLPRKSFRVSGSSNKKDILIRRAALDNWEVPGS